MFNFRQKTNSITTFADLKPGDIFREPNSSANFYYIKTCATDAANLITGYCFYWKPDDKVVAVTGTAANILKNDFNTTFADIGYGETFTTDSLNFNGYYMKINTNIPDYNAVNLINGKLCFFDSYQPIQITAIFYEV